MMKIVDKKEVINDVDLVISNKHIYKQDALNYIVRMLKGVNIDTSSIDINDLSYNNIHDNIRNIVASLDIPDYMALNFDHFETIEKNQMIIQKVNLAITKKNNIKKELYCTFEHYDKSIEVLKEIKNINELLKDCFVNMGFNENIYNLSTNITTFNRMYEDHEHLKNELKQIPKDMLDNIYKYIERLVTDMYQQACSTIGVIKLDLFDLGIIDELKI